MYDIISTIVIHHTHSLLCTFCQCYLLKTQIGIEKDNSTLKFWSLYVKSFTPFIANWGKDRRHTEVPSPQQTWVVRVPCKTVCFKPPFYNKGGMKVKKQAWRSIPLSPFMEIPASKAALSPSPEKHTPILFQAPTVSLWTTFFYRTPPFSEEKSTWQDNHLQDKTILQIPTATFPGALIAIPLEFT